MRTIDGKPRRVVDASTEPKEPKVRAMYDVRDPIPLADQPEALAEIIGRQLAGLRALSRDGARFDSDELEQLGSLAKTIATIVTAFKKVATDKPLNELTEEELKAQLAK